MKYHEISVVVKTETSGNQTLRPTSRVKLIDGQRGGDPRPTQFMNNLCTAEVFGDQWLCFYLFQQKY